MAAGGIVIREGSRPRVAIVRLRREKAWVLPKGKLYPGERPLAAAIREVQEETGHAVSVREFLGAMSYPADGKIKIVQFWHMQATGRPVCELMRDVKAVKWVSLKQAIDTRGCIKWADRRNCRWGSVRSGTCRERPAIISGHRVTRRIFDTLCDGCCIGGAKGQVVSRNKNHRCP